MMRTGDVSSWTDLAEIGPVYPFVGWEGLFVIACTVFWLAWIVWQLRSEKAEYEARRAERRYKAVDPDNRVVARTLEGEWEACLQELEVVRHHFFVCYLDATFIFQERDNFQSS